MILTLQMSEFLCKSNTIEIFYFILFLQIGRSLNVVHYLALKVFENNPAAKKLHAVGSILGIVPPSHPDIW